MRRVAAEVNIRGRDLGGFVAEAQTRLAGLESSLPPGYFLEYGGQFENQQRAMRRLSIVVPLALTLVLILLYMALGSFRDSLLVILNLPFALVGGVLAIAAIGMPLSVSAAVAFIVLLGIAVQNGVVLIAFFRQLRAEGRSVAETVRIGCDLRFRPLIMTALCSFIGHVPMLYATGSGADIQKPLAVVVMGGLVTSTILTLIVLPTIYEWLEEQEIVNRPRRPRRETGDRVHQAASALAGRHGPAGDPGADRDEHRQGPGLRARTRPKRAQPHHRGRDGVHPARADRGLLQRRAPRARCVDCIATNAHTGLTGDGKIYVTEVVEAVRISNGERGTSAI